MMNHKNWAKYGNFITYFWGVTGSIMLLLGLIGVFMLIKAFSKPKIYMLGDNEITSSTTTINNKTISIPYTDITEFKTTNVVNTRQLLIKSHHGKITIADMNFEYKSDFDEIVRTISQKIRM